MLDEGRRLLRQLPTWTMAFRDLAAEPFAERGCTGLFEAAVECTRWAVDELVRRLRPSRPVARPVVRTGGALGLLSS